ncbi:hypothetical protein B0H13DRAFT_2390623 [Mycena leptocephala]|nr:hypothetical protein B0H13DRAFT_2390623 [Mycena leptocephala]
MQKPTSISVRELAAIPQRPKVPSTHLAMPTHQFTPPHDPSLCMAHSVSIPAGIILIGMGGTWVSADVFARDAAAVDVYNSGWVCHMVVVLPRLLRSPVQTPATTRVAPFHRILLHPLPPPTGPPFGCACRMRALTCAPAAPGLPGAAAINAVTSLFHSHHHVATLLHCPPDYALYYPSPSSHLTRCTSLPVLVGVEHQPGLPRVYPAPAHPPHAPPESKRSGHNILASMAGPVLSPFCNRSGLMWESRDFAREYHARDPARLRTALTLLPDCNIASLTPSRTHTLYTTQRTKTPTTSTAAFAACCARRSRRLRPLPAYRVRVSRNATPRSNLTPAMHPERMTRAAKCMRSTCVSAPWCSAPAPPSGPSLIAPIPPSLLDTCARTHPMEARR